jgi:YidC/Oxa1 family membrane protein insertase
MALPNTQTIYRLTNPSALGSFNDRGEMKLVFEAESAGVKHIKTYVFFKNRHDFEVDHTVINQTSSALGLFLDQRLTRDAGAVPGESSLYHPFRGVAVYSDEDKYQKVDFSDIDKSNASFKAESSTGWVAQVQHYFVVAMLNEGARINQVQKLDINYYGVGNRISFNELAPNAQTSVTTKIFAGPQIQKELVAFAPTLDAVVDYGWLSFLAKPLFWLLGFLQSFLINWGWTIVALTVLIKLLFFPISASGYRAMAKMRELTPKLMALREKYQDDRLTQQREMMKLYQEEKVNPLGGCLPMIIPIPVFLALYWVLLGSVELRGADWLWIKDLSSKDPYYILPILMAITTFLQSKMSPPATDPLQAKMMLYMPLIFSVMFIWFPAGLVLYWVINNVLSIAQQWWINKTIAKAPRSQSGAKTNRKEPRDNMKNVGKKTVK